FRQIPTTPRFRMPNSKTEYVGVVNSNFFFILLVVLSCLTGNASAAEPVRTQANVPVEITFIAQLPHTDPFNDVTLDVKFTAPDKTVRTVPAFWAGGTMWKVRYSSAITGVHRWRSVSS